METPTSHQQTVGNFGWRVQIQEKRDSLEQIAQWRNRKKTEGKNTDDQDCNGLITAQLALVGVVPCEKDLEAILSRQQKRKEPEGSFGLHPVIVSTSCEMN